MTLLRKRSTFAAKIESVIGTPETLNAADGAFNAMNLSIQPTLEVEERPGQGGFDRLPGSPGARTGTMTFQTEIQWDGTATLPAWAETLLPACGLVKSSNVFTPRTEPPGANVKTLTMGRFVGGKFTSIAGAVGNARFVFPSGRKAFIDWTFQGVWQGEVDLALITPTFPTGTVLRYAGAATTYGGTALCLEQATLDLGNTLKLRECGSNVSGFIAGLVTDRYAIIEANPESAIVEDDPHYDDFQNGTEAAFSLAIPGPSGSEIAIAAPRAQIFNAQEGDRDGIQIDNLTLRCNKNGAAQDQAFSITFTPST